HPAAKCFRATPGIRVAGSGINLHFMCLQRCCPAYFVEFLMLIAESLPAFSTSDDTERRFGGLQRLYGQDANELLAAAHVAVIGIGGVGSWAAEALARSGIGQLTLIDLDHIAPSNVNRQIHA